LERHRYQRFAASWKRWREPVLSLMRRLGSTLSSRNIGAWKLL
jgi:hypothetical protein